MKKRLSGMIEKRHVVRCIAKEKYMIGKNTL